MAPTTVSNGGWDAIKVSVVFIVLDFIVVILRFVARNKSQAEFGADDGFAVLALLFLLANVSADFWSTMAKPSGAYP